MEERIERTLRNLRRNRFNCFYYETREEFLKEFSDSIKDGQRVAVGGSMTLFDLGIIDDLRSRDIEFIDRYAPGLTQDQLKDVFRQSFFTDVYLTSSNAITEEGELYNVEGRGNRVAAMLYGPDQVYVVAGTNKIVRDLDSAIERVKTICSPKNNYRLQTVNPCMKTGKCEECNSVYRICRDYVLIRKSEPGRITVFLINEDLGY